MADNPLAPSGKLGALTPEEAAAKMAARTPERQQAAYDRVLAAGAACLNGKLPDMDHEDFDYEDAAATLGKLFVKASHAMQREVEADREFMDYIDANDFLGTLAHGCLSNLGSKGGVIPKNYFNGSGPNSQAAFMFSAYGRAVLMLDAIYRFHQASDESALWIDSDRLEFANIVADKVMGHD